MDFYRRSYHTLFNAITDALRAMEDQNFGLAREQLIRSQLLFLYQTPNMTQTKM